MWARRRGASAVSTRKKYLGTSSLLHLISALLITVVRHLQSAVFADINAGVPELPPNPPLSDRCSALSYVIDNVRFRLHNPETKNEGRIFDANEGVLITIDVTPGSENGPAGPRATPNSIAEWASCHNGALLCFVLDGTREDLLLNAGMGPIHEDSNTTGNTRSSRDREYDIQTLWNVNAGVSHCWPVGLSNGEHLQFPPVHLRGASIGVHVLSAYVVNGITKRIATGEEFRSPHASIVFKFTASTQAEALRAARGQKIDPVRDLYNEQEEDMEHGVCLDAGCQSKRPYYSDSDLVLGFYWSHDAAVTVARGDGTIIFVLELERLFNKRYFMFNMTNEKVLRSQLARTRDAIIKSLMRDGLANSDDVIFQVAVFVDHPDHARGMSKWARQMEQKRSLGDVSSTSTPLPIFDIARQELPPARRWVQCDHHYAHSLYAFFDSSAQRALVVSSDAGGNDGTFSAYYGERLPQQDNSHHGPLALLGRLGHHFSLGGWYNRMAGMVPEVSNGIECDLSSDPGSCLRLPGILMGYAALGQPLPRNATMRRCMKDFLWSAGKRVCYFENGDRDRNMLQSQKGAQDFAATVQDIFEEEVLGLVDLFLDDYLNENDANSPEADPITLVLTGGCALNVKANSALRARYAHRGVRVYVPSSPNDGGLTVGGVWSVAPPLKWQSLTYTGFNLFELERAARGGILGELSKKCGGTKVGPRALARILVQETAVVGVARGRQEFGPRALGHRSLLARPVAGMKERMNRIKFRQDFRPVAPVLASGFTTERTFDGGGGAALESPYMSFAEPLRPEAAAEMPAIRHYDGTARPQTVSRQDNSWLHELLQAVGAITGRAVLINTSFNVRGEPMLNWARDAMRLLRDLPDLDYVLVEDLLFAKAGARSDLCGHFLDAELGA